MLPQPLPAAFLVQDSLKQGTPQLLHLIDEKGQHHQCGEYYGQVILPEPLLYLSAYFVARQQTYYDLLLSVSQQGSWETWLTFFLNGISSQARDAVARAQRMQNLRERYREQF